VYQSPLRFFISWSILHWDSTALILPRVYGFHASVFVGILVQVEARSFRLVRHMFEQWYKMWHISFRMWEFSQAWIWNCVLKFVDLVLWRTRPHVVLDINLTWSALGFQAMVTFNPLRSQVFKFWLYKFLHEYIGHHLRPKSKWKKINQYVVFEINFGKQECSLRRQATEA